MKSSVTTRELLSALADGQLSDEEFAATLDACGHDDASLDCWNAYQLIGEVLRSPACVVSPVAPGAELAFLGRLNERLAHESLTTAPPLAGTAPAPAPAPVVHHRGPASNDGNFRWKLVAGLASLAAVSTIAWNASGLLTAAPSPQLAQLAPPQVVVPSSQGPVVRDARLEELLAAHRQFGTASALQESSGFLRNATFETTQEAQAASGR